MRYEGAPVTLRHLWVSSAIALLLGVSVASADDGSSETGASSAEDGGLTGSAAYDPYPPVKAKPAGEDAWHQEVLVALIGGGPRFRNVRLDVGDFG